jgi:serine/threonine protein kinase
MAFLRIKSGNGAATTLLLREGTLRIGRSEGNDYQIADPSVSGRHCEVALDGNGNLLVRDLGSTNGTFVEGQRITEALMKPGQALRLGNVELAFENTKSANDAGVARVEPAEAILDQRDPVEDLGAMYLVSTPDGEYRAPADAAGHANLSASFARGVILQQRYVLERELGRGAMGQVFLARDIRLDRPVAIKVILATRGGQANADSSEAQELRRAFEEEAQVGANLNHPAIATVFDYGFHQGNPFTVFEYIEGETLQQFLHRRKRIPLDEVRLIVAPLAKGLDYAHSHHIVHRDLKPANIRTTPQGDFKILDLGLAKRLLQADERAGFAGTPAYASPEQASELPVDGRTDQYALALIVYEMITGQRPFQAEIPEEMLRLHREAAVPDPRSLAQDLPDATSAALLRALHKDPDQRFASCEALAVALGCQFLSAAAPAAPILLEAGVRTKRDFWREAGIGQRRHLALLSGCIWCDQGWEIRSWPIREIVGLKQFGKDLQFGLAKSGGGKQRFRFSSAEQCKDWCEGVAAQQRTVASQPYNDLFLQKPSPVVLLRQRPNMRLQLLGAVEAEGKRRRTREASLRIRGALLGADAVIGLEEERLPGIGKTVRRIAGTAVRAVDPAGRSELKGHWLNDRIARLTTFMFWLLGVSLVLKVLMLSLGRLDTIGVSEWLPGGQLLLTLPLGTMAVGLAVTYIWPLLLTVGLRGLRWPQLMPAAAITFPVQQALPVASIATIVIAASMAGDWARAGRNLLLLVAAVETWSLMFLGLLLGRRIWRTYREIRQTQGSVDEPPPRSRAWVGHLAVVVSLVMAVGWAVTAVRYGVRLGKAGGNDVSSLMMGRYTPQTNDLPDIGASWTLSSGWHEEAGSAQPGLQHGFRFTNNLVLAMVMVQDSHSLPPALRGNDQTVLQLARDREFRGLVRPKQLGDARPVQTSEMSWSELEFSAAPPAEPNVEQHYLLRAHGDSNCQATVVVLCRKELWGGFKDAIKSAADGFHQGILPSGRPLKAPGTTARFKTYKGTKRPYLWRLAGTWQLGKDPQMDLWLARADGLEVTVLLEDLSQALERTPLSVSQAAAMVLASLNTKRPGFQLLGREDVEVGGRRGQMLHSRYTVGKLAVTELRVLVLDSGWLYHVLALSTKPAPDPLQLEQLLAGFEFPRDSAR